MSTSDEDAMSPAPGPTSADSSDDGVYYEKRQRRGKMEWARVKQCDRCSKIIALGLGHGTNALSKHQGGSNCTKTTSSSLKTTKPRKRISDDPKQQSLARMFAPKARPPIAEPIASIVAPQEPQPTTQLGPNPSSPSIPTYVELSSDSCTSEEDNDELSVPFKPPTALPPHLLKQLNEGLCPSVCLPLSEPAYMAYPWQLHSSDQNLPYIIEFVTPEGHLYIRSKTCHGARRSHDRPCLECYSLLEKQDVKAIVKRSTGTLAMTTNYRFNNYTQLAQIAHNRQEDRKAQKLKILSLQRRYQTASAKLTDHEHFTQAIALDDRSAIGRVVAVAVRQHRSVPEIIRRIELSIRGLYHVKSFKERDFAIQKLVLSYGGPKLAFVLSKALDLPATRTAQQRMHTPKIRPCIGFPVASEIQSNLSTIHDSHVWSTREPSSPFGSQHRPMTLQLDEIALEEIPRYDTDRDAVLGFSRVNADLVDIHTVTENSLYAMVDAIQDGTLSVATEATVAALAPYDPEHYHPVPLMISGTCKREGDAEQARWIQLLINTYNTSDCGANLYGPLVSIASDGDAVRRRALHRICMSCTLSEADSIWHIIGRLPLMNLSCGKNQLTADFDYKHKIKNFASAIRAIGGLLVASHHITPITTRAVLSKHLGWDLAKLNTLFNNKDHMNVKNAVELLSGIHTLSMTVNLDVPDPDLVPYVLLGRVLGYLVNPFKTQSMSLSEQLRSLSAAGHLLCLLFRKNRTGFMPGQLYYDIQTLIKDAYWTTAKMQVDFPDSQFYIIHKGEDRLEGMFGEWRTQEHNRNMDISRCGDCASMSTQNLAIFAQYPEWDRGHRRLNFAGTQGVDHTNPKSWTGDVHVSQVSLLTEWNSGRREVTRLVERLRVDLDDFASLPADVDLLRPRGDYVGLREDDIDFTAGWIDEDTVRLEKPTDEDGQEIQIDEEDGLQQLEDLLPSNSIGDGLNEADPRAKERNWLALPNNKSCHKSSAVRYLLSSEEGRKSTDRLARVQGLSKIRSYSRHPSNLTSTSLSDDSMVGDNFLIHQLVACFIRVEDKPVLAIIRVSAIEDEHKTFVPSIPIASLTSERVHLRGQVLTLERANESRNLWVWKPQCFEAFAQKNSNSADVSKKATILEVPACITEPVKASLKLCDGRYTFVFENETLEALTDLLWEKVQSSIKLIPLRKATSTFPLRDDDMMFLFYNEEGAEALASGTKGGNEKCYLCQAEVEGKLLRFHIASHLLCERYNIHTTLKFPIGSHPCGFCGRSGTCDVGLKKTNSKTFIPTSTCSQKVKFKMKSAIKPTKAGPSTNRPLRCRICHEQQDTNGRLPRLLDEHVHWSYNMPAHIAEKHPKDIVEDDFEEEYAITATELGLLKIKTADASASGRKRGKKRKVAIVEESDQEEGSDSDDERPDKRVRK